MAARGAEKRPEENMAAESGSQSLMLTMMTPERREAFLALQRRLMNNCHKSNDDDASVEVDKLLSELTKFGLAGNEPCDTPEVDLKTSQRKTAEVLSKLERELFSEEERRFIVKLEKLQKKYKHKETGEYKRELAQLIADM